MDNRTTMQQTVAFYCRELLEELDGYEEVRFDRKGLALAVQRGMQEAHDPAIMRDLHRRLMTVAEECMAIFSRHPTFTRFERFYIRTQSIMEMCRPLMEAQTAQEDT